MNKKRKPPPLTKRTTRHFLNKGDAARYLNVNTATIENLLDQKYLSPRVIDNVVMFKRCELHNFDGVRDKDIDNIGSINIRIGRF